MITRNTITRPIPPQMDLSWLERGLARFGLYGTALRRFARRATYEQHRYYMDAAKVDRTTGDWKRVGANAADVTKSDAKRARERARAMVLSNGYARRAKQMLVDSTVGSGIQTQCQIAWSRSNDVSTQKNTELETHKKRWAETAHVDGQQHWADVQQQIMGQVIEAGSVLLHARYIADRYTSEGKNPLAFDVIEIDRLTEFRAAADEGNTVAQGIEYDPNGQVIAYHIDNGDYRASTSRIPAAQMRQVYRVDRPGQPIGITWFAPVIPDLQMLKDLQTYDIIRRKVQSALAVIITDPQNGIGAAPSLPGVTKTSGGDATNSTGDPQRFIEPGMIHRAGAGQVTPFMPAPLQDTDDVVKILLRGVGAGMGISYEWVSGDYRSTSFAGGRLTLQDTKKHILPVHAWYCRRAESWAHRLWIDTELQFGLMTDPPAKANIYAAKFSKPRWEHAVNPQQEVRAVVEKIEAGLTTLRQEVESEGGDFDETLKQLYTERQDGSALGMLLHQALFGDDHE